MKIDKNYWLIGILGTCFFIPFLGGVHLFDWDEINFAECSREMILRGEYLRPQINFEPFWEKPPLFMWLQTLSMHIFGINEYAARFPNAVCGISTLLIIYHLGKKLYDKSFGLYWVLAYFGSILPHLYFKSGIIDPWFNLFIFLSLIFLMRAEDKNKESVAQTFLGKFQLKNLIIGGIFSGLAILTKGPAGYLIVSLTWLCKLLIYKELNWNNIKRYALFSMTTFFVTMIWFGVETIQNGFWFITTFVEYNIRLAKTEDAGHGGFPGYHFVVIFFGCFPASIFALRTLYKSYNFFNEKVDFTRWMKILFWVVIILFSIVQSKIVHYSSMCYLPLTFMAAISIKNIVDNGFFYPFKKNLLVGIGVLIALIVLFVPIVGQNIHWLRPLFQHDLFALKNLDANVQWSSISLLSGIFYLVAVMSFIFIVKKVGLFPKLKYTEGGVVYLFFSTAIFVNLVLIQFINNIEGYSQNAAIEFYQSKAQEDCYIATFGYKSYAHLFYAQKRIPSNPMHSNNEWLMRGAVDKPTYWVAKYTLKSHLDAMPNLQFIYEKNGFVFYKRI